MTTEYKVVQENGNTYWYSLDGKRHRTDGPAVERADGFKSWYIGDNLHRTDGPAVEYSDGSKHWYLDGKRHRTDGPAIEDDDGSKTWYLDGKLHRTDGPAIERAGGTKDWYLDDKRLTEAEFLAQTDKQDNCDGKVVKIEGRKYRLIAVVV